MFYHKLSHNVLKKLPCDVSGLIRPIKATSFKQNLCSKKANVVGFLPGNQEVRHLLFTPSSANTQCVMSGKLFNRVLKPCLLSNTGLKEHYALVYPVTLPFII
jgi:hypothetical protein